MSREIACGHLPKVLSVSSVSRGKIGVDFKSSGQSEARDSHGGRGREGAGGGDVSAAHPAMALSLSTSGHASPSGFLKRKEKRPEDHG